MKRLTLLFLLASGVASAQAVAQSTMQGDVTVAGAISPTAAYSNAFRARTTLTTDTATSPVSLTGQHAWSQATGGNQTGGTLYLGGGIGSRFYTVVTYASTGGKTVTITVNGGTPTVYTEGGTWQCVSAGSNNACATNLANTINADGALNAYITATASGAVVYLDPKKYAYSLTIATNAGAPLTATSGTNGTIAATFGALAASSLTLNGATSGTASITVAATGGTMTLNTVTIASNGYITGNNFTGSYATSGNAEIVIDTTKVGVGLKPIQWALTNGTQAPVVKMQGNEKALTNNSATGFVKIALASDTATGGEIRYTVRVTDTTNHKVQSTSGTLPFSAINENGTITVGTLTAANVLATLSAATTDAISFTSSATAADFTISVTSNSNLSVIATHVIDWVVIGPGVTGTITNL